MATETIHYNLTKPSYGDPIDIGVLNSNADTIDSVMHSLQTQIYDGRLLVAHFNVPSLPHEENIADVTPEMVVVSSIVHTPQEQTGEWTVETATGTITITGASDSIGENGTDLTLYLIEQRQ